MIAAVGEPRPHPARRLPFPRSPPEGCAVRTAVSATEDVGATDAPVLPSRRSSAGPLPIRPIGHAGTRPTTDVRRSLPVIILRTCTSPTDLDHRIGSTAATRGPHRPHPAITPTEWPGRHGHRPGPHRERPGLRRLRSAAPTITPGLHPGPGPTRTCGHHHTPGSTRTSGSTRAPAPPGPPAPPAPPGTTTPPGPTRTSGSTRAPAPPGPPAPPTPPGSTCAQAPPGPPAPPAPPGTTRTLRLHRHPRELRPEIQDALHRSRAAGTPLPPITPTPLPRGTTAIEHPPHATWCGGRERCRGDRVIQAAARQAPSDSDTGRIRECGNAARRRMGARGPRQRSWPPH